MFNGSSEKPNGERACPRCGTVFSCGLAAHEESCWCFELPRIVTRAQSSREGCVCPACLKLQIEQIQAEEEKASSS